LEAEEDEEEAEAEEASMPRERMEAIQGRWVLEGQGGGLPVEVTLEEGTLYAHPLNQPRFPLTITSDSTVTYEGVDATVVFHFEADGTVNRATHFQGGEIPMRRVAEEEMTAEEMGAFEGRFFCEELELLVHVSVDEEGGLSLELPAGDRISLEHTSGTEFSGSFPYGNVAFQRAGNGSVTGFTVGNGRTKGVLFRRW
jgi:hypothetical protein